MNPHAEGVMQQRKVAAKSLKCSPCRQRTAETARNRTEASYAKRHDVAQSGVYLAFDFE